jgi:hypothetical protein
VAGLGSPCRSGPAQGQTPGAAAGAVWEHGCIDIEPRQGCSSVHKHPSAQASKCTSINSLL